MIKLLIRIPLIFIFIFGMIQCADVSPDDTKITIDPASFTIEGLADERLYESFKISVKNKEGEPLNGVKITISFLFAPDFNCPPSAALCTDPPARLLDKNKEYQSSPFTTKTDEDGTYTVWLEYWHGAAWKGTLEVNSGTAYQKADVEVKE